MRALVAFGAVGEGLPISLLFDGFDLDFIGSVARARDLSIDSRSILVKIV